MDKPFDIFLSHNSQDKAEIRLLKARLSEYGLKAWLDEDELQPGLNWIPLLEAAIEQCQSAGAFVGGNGIGPWESEEIQALLQQAVNDGTAVIPVLLPGDYAEPKLPLFLRNRTYIDMRAGLTDEALDKLVWGITGQKPQRQQQSPTSPTILIDQLPTVPGEFFGREEELAMLDQALAGDDTRILQFIAAGGTGKTKLLRHWLNRVEDQLGNRIIWSFYSQGTTEAKQVSSSPLLDAAFKQFGVDAAEYATEEDRADAFVDLLIQHRCLLILDGLEPLQHADAVQVGQLKDRALLRLLKRLRGTPGALCIISSRLPVYELNGLGHVAHCDLNNLRPADGVRLLQSHGIQARESVLRGIVNKIQGHALTLHLLGNAIQTHLGGDALRLDTLESWLDDYDPQGRHAFKVMSAYESGLRDDQGKPLPELRLLYLLGLFDHPVETQVLQVLWDAQIPELTQGIARPAWNNAIRNLRERHRLLSQHTEPATESEAESAAANSSTAAAKRSELLDCHPLIREYFGGRLQAHYPQAHQQAHQTLYQFYQDLPAKQQPDTLDELRPLFAAVAHGCAAGLHQQALEDVYWPRIRREGENYLCSKLGRFSDDLACVAHFFATPWQRPAAELTPADKAVVLNWAGFRLRALGRLREALEPMRAAMEMFAQQENWKEAAMNAGNLSELQLTLGDVADALHSAAQAVDYADRSKDMFEPLKQRTKKADAAHQAARWPLALELFQAAEQLQQEWQPTYPRLYSLPGFRYCDLLLSQAGADAGKIGVVVERYEEWVKWRQDGDSLLSRALEYLTLARAHQQSKQWPQANAWLAKAVAGLREAGATHNLPWGLLTQASLQRQQGHYAQAAQTLQEIRDIAKPSGMRLHLTDYHLEADRLAHAQAKPPADIQAHLDQAAQLIQATGYRRRDGELAELQRTLP